MFKSRPPVQDKEAGLMMMIMTPIATCSRLLSPARFLGWSGLSGSWLLGRSTWGSSSALRRQGRQTLTFWSFRPSTAVGKSCFWAGPWGRVRRWQWAGGCLCPAARGLWRHPGGLCPWGPSKAAKGTEGACDHRLGTCPTASAAAHRRFSFFPFCAWSLWLPLCSLLALTRPFTWMKNSSWGITRKLKASTVLQVVTEAITLWQCYLCPSVPIFPIYLC